MEHRCIGLALSTSLPSIYCVHICHLYIVIIFENEADNLFVAEECEMRVCLCVGNSRYESIAPQWSKGWKQNTHNSLVFQP